MTLSFCSLKQYYCFREQKDNVMVVSNPMQDFIYIDEVLHASLAWDCGRWAPNMRVVALCLDPPFLLEEYIWYAYIAGGVYYYAATITTLRSNSNSYYIIIRKRCEEHFSIIIIF